MSVLNISTTMADNATCIVNNVTSQSSVLLYVTVGSLQSALIIICNFLIIFSVAKFPRLRITSNLLIANLAVSDLLVGLILIPVNMACIMYPELNNNKYSCIIKVFNWVFIFGSAIFGLLLISFDRVFALTAPWKYSVTKTKLISLSACLFTWISWISTCALSFFVFNHWSCWRLCTVANVVQKSAFQFIAFILGIGFLLSCLSFLLILFKLFKFDSRNTSRRNTDIKRRTSLMALVFGLFVLFLIPLLISAFYASSFDVIENRMMIEWLVLLCSTNSVVNGFIYGWKRSEFRKAYLAILLCKNGNRIQSTTSHANDSSNSRIQNKPVSAISIEVQKAATGSDVFCG